MVEIKEVENWASSLEELHARIAPRFARSEQRGRVLAYLRGLLSPVKRKNGWQLAEQAGEKNPDGIQRLLNNALWDADEVRDDLREYVVEHLGEGEAVLVVDETGFLKKGHKSVGVKRQYSGTAGRIENCQIGVFLAYASSKGHTLLDRELYLPKEWATDVERRKEAGVPQEVQFATKPQLAQMMLERALQAGVPCKWVTADEIYGGDRHLRIWLEGQEQAFVLAVTSNEPLWCDIGRGLRQERVSAMVASIKDADDQWQKWQRLSAGDGAKGPRLYDWARVPLERLTWLGLGPGEEPRWEHWLLVRRSIEKPEELAYYVVFCPVDTELQELVQVAGRRWTIEESFEITKDEVGLDEYEVRRWTGWYRHITLAMLAQAYLTVTRYYAAEREREKGGG
ncbi:MAG TPA: IS701 family transposase [Ktedonobacteraceae bacterium]